MADIFVAAQKKLQPWSYNLWKTTRDSRKITKQHHQKPEVGECKLTTRKNQSTGKPLKPLGRKPICYLCGVEGHAKPMCPENTLKLNNVCFAGP